MVWCIVDLVIMVVVLEQAIEYFYSMAKQVECIEESSENRHNSNNLNLSTFLLMNHSTKIFNYLSQYVII